MTMRIYKSTDSSAPTLQGIVGGALSGSDWADGSLLQLLRKCLVTGYGSKTAAGWAQSFAGTSEGVFKQGSGCNFYIHVLDDGSLTAGAREAAFYGAETMSALSTGTGLFPTTGQQATGLKLRKSDTADATHRDWILFADDRTFYLYVNSGLAGTPYYAGMAFGDFTTYKTADAYNCIAIGRVTTAATDSTANEVLDQLNAPGATNIGHYVPRGYSQAGTSVQVAKLGSIFSSSAGGVNTAGNATSMLPFPNPVDDKFWLSRAYILDPTTAPVNSVRGYLRGWWTTQHAGASTPLEYDFGGLGTLVGRAFRVLGLRTGNSSSGRYVMETSDTWD